jgi:hypothetical protein
MSTKPEDLWTKAEYSYLERMWGYMPLTAIADALGRSETAVSVLIDGVAMDNALAAWQVENE